MNTGRMLQAIQAIIEKRTGGKVVIHEGEIPCGNDNINAYRVGSCRYSGGSPSRYRRAV